MRLFRIARAINKYHRFYEYQNGKTNFSLSPTYEKHGSYVAISHDIECVKVNDLPIEDKCDFVTNTEECQENSAYIDYMNFIFCTVNSPNFFYHYGAILLLVIFLLYLFTILGTTADKFFCSALAVLSKAMGLSENLAGVTLLAFGNGSPDIITALVDAEGDTEMMYAELLGAAAFITGIIAGIIIIIKPFQLNKSNYIRDIIFFIFSCVYIFWFMGDQTVDLGEAAGNIIIYLIFLIVVIAEHILIQKKIIRTNEKYDARPSIELQDKLAELNKDAAVVIKDKDKNVIDGSGRRVSSMPGLSKNTQLFSKFWESVNPIDLEEWNESGILGKMFQIIQVPAMLVLNLVIPLVDYNADTNGWCKLLNIVHCITLPMFGLLVSDLIFVDFNGFPLFIIFLLVGIIFAVIIFFTSRTDTAPKYHLVFAILAFIGSILVIFVVANEVVSILTTIGFITKLSHSMLGISVFAWGNSVGDLIANIALAKQGYSKMGFAACYGGPMFNTLVGMGATFLIKCYSHADRIAFVRDGAMGNNCIFFLISILLFSLIAAMLTNFQARRSLGFIMVGMYIFFFIFCILCEMEVIHPYGTDHVDEGEFVQ